MQRSHRRRDDLSWLAPEVARAQRRAAWSVWGGSAVAIGGTVAMLPPLLLFWKGFVLAGAGIAAAGHQIGRMTLQRQLRKLAAGQLPLSALDARAAGELVVVRGRIECAAPLTGILVDRPAVYRRLHWRPDGRWFSEAAVDFELVDAAGHRVMVHAAGARWMTPEAEDIEYPGARLDRDGLPEHLRAAARQRETIQAHEQVLELGAEVQIVAHKATTASVDGVVTDMRLPPQRTSLRSGPDLPLVITRLRDLEVQDLDGRPRPDGG